MMAITDILPSISGIKGALPVSYSRMQQLFNCPLAFTLKYIRKTRLPEPQLSDDIVLGKRAHWVMENTVHHAALNDAYESAFNFYHARALESSSNEFQRMRMQQLYEPMHGVCERLCKMLSVPDTYAYTEKNIKLSTLGIPVKGKTPFKGFGKPSSLGFTGYIDLEMRRGGKLNLVDYKTELPSDSRRQEVISQTAVYAYIEFISDPTIDTASTYCIYLRDGTVDKVASYNRADNFNALEDKVLGMFTRYAQILKEGVLPEPKENKYCVYCGFKDAGMCTLKG